MLYWKKVNPALIGDAPRYLYMAKCILDHDFRHFLHYHYPPLYPLFLAPFVAVTPDHPTAARAAGLAATMLAIIPLFILARQLFNPATALLVLALWPLAFIRAPLAGDAQAFFNLLLAVAFTSGFSAIQSERLRPAFLSGAAFGLATLTKMEAQAFFLLWLCVLILAAFFNAAPRWNILTKLFLAAIGYLLVMAPYLAAYSRETGRVTLNPKAPVLFYSYNEPDWNQAWYALRRDEHGLFTLHQRVIAEGDRRPLALDPASYLAANAGRLLPVYLNRLGFTFTRIMPHLLRLLWPGSAFLAGLVVLAGIVSGCGTRDRLGRGLYLLAFGCLPLFTVPLFHPLNRFFFPLIPVLVLFFARGLEKIAAGLAAAAGRLTGEERSRCARRGVWGMALLAAWAPGGYFLFRQPAEGAYHAKVQERQAVAKHLRDNLAPGSKIMSLAGDLPYWYLAGLSPERDLAFPLASLDETLAYARQEGVELMVVDNAETAERYPQLRPLLQDTFHHPRMERVFTRRGSDRRYYLIYRTRW
jgi:hypothetical protein